MEEGEISGSDDGKLTDGDVDLRKETVSGEKSKKRSSKKEKHKRRKPRGGPRDKHERSKKSSKKRKYCYEPDRECSEPEAKYSHRQNESNRGVDIWDTDLRDQRSKVDDGFWGFAGYNGRKSLKMNDEGMDDGGYGLDVAPFEKKDTFSPAGRRDDQHRHQREQERRAKKSREYFERRRNMDRRESQVICRFYSEGRCEKGKNCQFRHSSVQENKPPTKKSNGLCKFYASVGCVKGDSCNYMHKEFPCKFFHLYNGDCHKGDGCKFSHDPLTPEARALLKASCSRDQLPTDALDNMPDNKGRGEVDTWSDDGNDDNPMGFSSEVNEDQLHYDCNDNRQMNYKPFEVYEEFRRPAFPPVGVLPMAVGPRPLRQFHPMSALAARRLDPINEGYRPNGNPVGPGAPLQPPLVPPPPPGSRYNYPMGPAGLMPMQRGRLLPPRPLGHPLRRLPQPMPHQPYPGRVIQPQLSMHHGAPSGFFAHAPPPMMSATTGKALDQQIDKFASLFEPGKVDDGTGLCGVADGHNNNNNNTPPQNDNLQEWFENHNAEPSDDFSSHSPILRKAGALSHTISLFPSTVKPEALSFNASVFDPSVSEPLPTIRLDSEDHDSVEKKLDSLQSGNESVEKIRLHDMQWKLQPLDIPVKIPYPLIKLPARIPNMHNDPRLKGVHHPQLTPNQPPLVDPRANTSSLIPTEIDEVKVSIQSAEIPKPEPGSLPSAKNIAESLSGVSSTTEIDAESFTKIDSDKLLASLAPKRPNVKLNQFSSAFIKKPLLAVLAEDDLSGNNGSRSYLSDPRFKRKKLVSTSSSQDCTMVKDESATPTP